MPLYMCSQCHCVENTVTGEYWIQEMDKTEKLCSECNPNINSWHGRFPKRSAHGRIRAGEFLWDSVEQVPAFYRNSIEGVIQIENGAVKIEPIEVIE